MRTSSSLKVVICLVIALICLADTNQRIEDIYYSKLHEHNEEAFRTLMKLHTDANGWKHVNKKDGIVVQKRFLPAGSFVAPQDASKGSKHACVRATGVVDAPPDQVFELFLDNGRVHEYNEHCIEVEDIDYFQKRRSGPMGADTWTKATWAAGPKYGVFKPRDFCSFVHYVSKSDGTRIVLNRPAYHSSYEPVGSHVRACVLLAGNIMEPLDGGRRTRYTQIAHVNPGGGADTKAIAFIVNSLCAVGPPGFIRKLEAAAKCTPAEEVELPIRRRVLTAMTKWGDAQRVRTARPAFTPGFPKLSLPKFGK